MATFTETRFLKEEIALTRQLDADSGDFIYVFTYSAQTGTEAKVPVRGLTRAREIRPGDPLHEALEKVRQELKAELKTEAGIV